jgi:hypothetical protein
MNDPTSRIPTIGPFLEAIGYQLSNSDALYHTPIMTLATCAVMTDSSMRCACSTVP